MGVSYKKLFKLLIDKDMKKKDLLKIADISPSIITRMGKNEYVSMDALVKICVALDVEIGDVVEIVRLESCE